MQKIELLGPVEHWLILNDGVMGGLSKSQVCETSMGLEFRGYLSLKNNGGFASIRKTVNVSLDGIIGFRLELKGDGRCYQFRLRQDEDPRSVAWRRQFKTDSSLQEVTILLNEFKLVYRGHPVPGAGALIPAAIRQLGFMLVDKIEGPFRLLIRSIEPLFTGNPLEVDDKALGGRAHSNSP